MPRYNKMIYILTFFSIFCFSAISMANDVKILSSSDQQLTLEITPEAWRFETIRTNGDMFQRITFTGAEVTGEKGAPLMPARIFSLGIPQLGSISAQIISSDYKTVKDITLAPIPRTIRQDVGYKMEYIIDELEYQRQSYPTKIIEIENPVIFRQQRIAKILIYPIEYFPQQKMVKIYNRLTVQFNFSNSGELAYSPSYKPSDEEIYQNLVNYQQSRKWRLKPQPLKKAKNSFSGNNWYKIIISSTGSGGKEGMYKLTGEILQQALNKNNIALSDIDPTTLQLFNNGGKVISSDIIKTKNDTLIENPILIVGAEDGTLNAQDYILFYGRSLEGTEFDPQVGHLKHYINPYSYNNVYWLTFNKNIGKRIQKVNSLSTSGLVEESAFYDLAWIEEEKHNIFKSGIDWLGYEFANDKNAYSANFTLPGAVTEENAYFRFVIASVTSGQHYFTVYVNGNQIGQFDQNGGASSFTLYERSFSSPGVLVDGDNTITINYNLNSDIAFSYLDWIEVQYKRRFLALDDQLIFFSPPTNNQTRYRINGFSRDDIQIFEVSDISNITEIIPQEKTNGSVDFSAAASYYSSPHYVAVTPAAYKSIKVSDITAQDMAGLRVTKNVDYIIISYDDFYQQAMQLESLRENWSPKDRLETEIVNYSDVINEFGWGIPDPGAIRNFLAWSQDNWGNPGYVLLVGDGHYDYKNILRQNVPNLILPYETEGTNENYTRTTDDWYTYTKGEDQGMQMAIGRLVVNTVDEAQSVIDKIVQYETQPEYGEWLKTICIVADDEKTAGGKDTRELLHTHQAEELAENHVPDLLDVKKIYLINYPEQRTASVSGITKPGATNALLEQINRGSLIINYIGHGNDELWAHERVLLGSRDFDKIQNGKRMALWVAATCEFAHWDQPSDQSLAEDILSIPGQGAVSMISSARLAFAYENAAFNYALYDNLFRNYETSGKTARVGDAVMLAKQNKYSRRNNEKYALFGDPAMRLCAPQYHAVIDKINPDSIQALSKMELEGHIENETQAALDYEGKILVRVLDTRKPYQYVSESGDVSDTLWANGNNIFRGVARIEDGLYNLKFIVPKDISYGGTDGRISLYFWNEENSGSGYEKNLIVGGTAVDLVDNKGPEMFLHLGDASFVPGDYVSTRPTLHMNISDSLSGVNTAGDIGHQIMLTIDEDFAQSKDITEYFTYDEGSYTTGSLSYTIFDLPIGEHTLQVKAWDNSNNSSIFETFFVVIDDSKLEIRDPLTFPNPMADNCSFRFELSQDANVELKLFTVAGRLIKNFETYPGRVGYNVFPIEWDGRDEGGHLVANGVYLYKIVAKSFRNGETIQTEKIEKLIISR